jgi:hypothetical protein
VLKAASWQLALELTHALVNLTGSFITLLGAVKLTRISQSEGVLTAVAANAPGSNVCCLSEGVAPARVDPQSDVLQLPSLESSGHRPRESHALNSWDRSHMAAQHNSVQVLLELALVVEM